MEPFQWQKSLYNIDDTLFDSPTVFQWVGCRLLYVGYTIGSNPIGRTVFFKGLLKGLFSVQSVEMC